MAKRILITNDDGIKSDGIIRLAKAAKEFGEVYVIAPDDQRSAASHSITLRHGIDVFPYNFPVEGVKAYSCSGTPADCVRVGSLSVMPVKPDIVMSGINFGYNVASDIQYSATVGAALEGEFQGYLSIAFSEGMNGIHETTDKYLRDIMAELVEKEYTPGFIYNVNFPGCKLEKCKGVLKDRVVSRSAFYKDSYKEIEQLPNDGVRYMVDGAFSPTPEEGTDYGAILDNYVSIGLVENLC